MKANKSKFLVCAKCKSKNLVKPANDEGWLFKCLDCGRVVKKNFPPITTGVCYNHTDEGAFEEI